MERGDPVKQRQRDYRLEENEEGDAASLELTLRPPGEEPCKKKGNQRTLHFLSLGTPATTTTTTIACPSSSYLDVEEEEDGGERKAGAYFVPPPLATDVQKSQKRCAPAAVVGWPPIRSYRRNIAGSSGGGKLQPVPETPNVAPKRGDFEEPVNAQSKGLFVKINMDGVPIGRKVDLKSCESYEKLATLVDELFRGLLADSSGHETEKPIAGLLDGTGEYTLVYEDHEGDRMLVSDVPWRMFVATAKRLRVLKRCELSDTNLGGRKQENKSPL